MCEGNEPGIVEECVRIIQSVCSLVVWSSCNQDMHVSFNLTRSGMLST